MTRPAFPPASASLRRAKQKNFLYIFLIACPQIFFQLRKRKFFCFVLPLTRKGGNASHPRRSGRAKIHFPQTPFSFCPLAFGLRPIFLRTGYKSKGWRVGLELKSGHRLIFNVLTMIYFLNKTIPLIFCYLLLQNIFHIH